MARKGNKVDGWIIIDKDSGMTSADVVRRVKRILHPQKIGHAGTLDPLATGILPLALGEATKTVSYITDAIKEYEFTIRWGEERTTDDSEGDVVKTSNLRPGEKDIIKELPGFIGEIEQIPPQFSALKVDGQRAYKLARAGERVELKPRLVKIDTFEPILGQNDKDHASFHVICGKGTYIRALARDLGRKLQCFGHITAICRTVVGPYSQSRAFSLAKLDDLSHSARVLEALIPVMTALDDIPALAVTKDEARRIKNGQVIRLPTKKSGTVCLTLDKTLVALATVEDGETRPLRIFNLN
ncbi:MAG: tRNA pseudouridine(55) synthase TruB [Alphaproteobacteria bacterium]|nr:MAG: tRNA pseudouridine(55) synthase TruB [Alphaproteobacteria bacterium]